MAPNGKAGHMLSELRWSCSSTPDVHSNALLTTVFQQQNDLISAIESKPHDDDAILHLIRDSPTLTQDGGKMILCGENCIVKPLHSAVFHNCSVAVLQALYDAHPAAISISEPRGGRYPIHIALLKGGTAIGLDRIDLLLDLWPECTTKAIDALGNSPLHVAVQYSTEIVIRRVLSANTQATELLTLRQRTALHLLASARCQWSTTKVTSTFPSDREVEDAMLAASLTIGTATLQAVVDACPAALQQTDMQGRLPLHLLAGAPFPRWDCLQLLCNAYSPALLVTDGDHKTPLQLHQMFGSCCQSVCPDLSESSSRSGTQTDIDLITAFLQDRSASEKRKNGLLFKFLSKVQTKKNKTNGAAAPVIDLMNCYG